MIPMGRRIGVIGTPLAGKRAIVGGPAHDWE